MLEIERQKTLITMRAVSALICMTVALPALSQAKTGILNITSDPTGALVYIDGKMKGTTPILLEIPATEHDVVLEQQGYDTYRARIRVVQDKVFRTNVVLKKPTQDKPKIELKNDIQIHQPAENAEPGTVFLTTTPERLTAYVDGFAISRPTPVAFDIRPGIYELMLKNDRSEIVYKKTIFVRSGKTLSLDIIIQKKRTIDYSDPWK
jgi:hypothetical protein